MLNGGDHGLQCVGARVKEGVGHASVDLVLKVLPLAVAGGLPAQAQGAQGVADAGFKDTVLDLGDVPGRGALVVKGVGGHVHRAQSPLVHGDPVGADPLADIVRPQGPALDEHVHLDPVAEGLVGDQAGDVRGGDDVVFPRRDPLGGKELIYILERLVQHMGQVVEQLRPDPAGNALAAHLRPPVPAARADHAALRIDVGLAQVPALGQKQLADVGGLGAGRAVQQMLPALHPLVGHGGQVLNQPADVLVLRQAARLHLDQKGLRLVVQDTRFVHGDLCFLQQGKLPVQLLPDLLCRLFRVGRVKAVEGSLAVQAVFVHPHDGAPLGGHGLVGDGLGPLGNGHMKAHGIRGQDADIFIPPGQKPDQLLQPRGNRRQIGGKWCFHCLASCWGCLFTMKPVSGSACASSSSSNSS